MIISSQRHLFSIPRDICYLNAAYMTPQSHAMLKAGQKGLELRSSPWLTSEESFFTDVERVRGLCAQIVGAKADDIALIPAASYGVAVAAKNIKLRQGQSIIVLEEQFPSNIYSWVKMADEQGLNIITVAKPHDGNWSQAVLNTMEHEGENVGMLALPHCHWADGGLLDLVEISKKAKEHGAFLVLELTQSLGALPFDVADIDADYVIAASYKWMFCPYATGFMYVAPRNQSGEPLEENWINRKGSENFANLVNYVDEYQQGARRFDMGERANFGLMLQMESSLSQLLNWGIGNIAQTIAQKNKTICEVFAKYGFTPCYDEDNRAHILGLESEQQLPDGFMGRLSDEGVRLSVRGQAIRIAPHVYNDQEDLELLKTALKKIFSEP